MCRPLEACCTGGSWALGLIALEGGLGPSGSHRTVIGQGGVCTHARVGLLGAGFRGVLADLVNVL